MRRSQEFYSHPCLQSHPICQQNLRGCRPTLEHRPQIIFIIFGLLHLIIGILILFCSRDVVEYKMRYDDKCGLSENRTTGSTILEFDNPASSAKFYMYYELHDFYQSHFRFANSYSKSQIRGNYVEDTNDCDPIRSEYTETMVPCGLMSQYFFTDYYQVLNGDFSDEKIAWNHEKGNLYKMPNDEYPESARWMKDSSISRNFPNETMNEHFMVWMRLSPHKTFRKLFAISQNGIPQNAQVQVSCDYPYTNFHGERFVVFMKLGGLGGENLLLGILNIVMCAITIIFTVAFLMMKKQRQRRRRNAIDDEAPVELQEEP
ncbi:cell cycle control protein [Tritrichomonas foetus]|uniref:Cell cycle control protein n=1 Tax=Tritrichomonas foetus TaxID=1144522 RepID=A0A1J4JDN6_9EUKA|nr:cell cycle control protein [Tritrichomonas foetus]|eukprot:OHS97266.1 cell cycle control protein [Tritrichomonas foetus]